MTPPQKTPQKQTNKQNKTLEVPVAQWQTYTPTTSNLSEFEFPSRNYVHFLTGNLRKSMKSLIPSAMV